MKLVKEIGTLVRKDLLLEWRQKYALGGIVLYVVSTVFVIYLINTQQGLLDRMDERIWSALFWITILFAAVNAVAKSFTQESKERQLYYYTVASPQAVILAKMLYNTLLMLLLAALCWGVFSVMVGPMVKTTFVFVAALLLGGTGFSFILTMVSGIAAKAGNNATLMAVLSFPIILPLIMLLQQLAQQAFFTQVEMDKLLQQMGTLALFDAMIVTLAFVLFPYIWHD